MIKDGGVIEYVESNKIGLVDRDKNNHVGMKKIFLMSSKKR